MASDTTEFAEAGPDYFADEAATFGDRVMAARQDLGLSPGELSGRLGIQPKTLSRWENDQAEPRANKLQMLAGVLNVSMIWLLTGEGEGVNEAETDPATQAVLLDEVRALKDEAAALSRRAARLEKALRTRAYGDT